MLSIPKGQGDLLAQIKATLKQGKPVGIEYQNRIWTTGGSHASSVVGSRKKNGRCQLLVRGSYGANCDKLFANMECDKDDPGNVWVDEADLGKMLHTINYFIPKTPR